MGVGCLEWGWGGLTLASEPSNDLSLACSFTFRIRVREKPSEDAEVGCWDSFERGVGLF